MEFFSVLLADGKSLPSKSTISVYSDKEILVSLLLVLSAMYSIMEDLPTPGLPSSKIALSNCNPLMIRCMSDWVLEELIE